MSFASGKVKAKKAKKSSAPIHEDEIEEERENDELQAEMRFVYNNTQSKFIYNCLYSLYYMYILYLHTELWRKFEIPKH